MLLGKKGWNADLGMWGCADVGMCGFGDVGMCGFVDEIGGK